ncbi:STAM-binding protein-like A [Corticium candelabrum]|uniref:STAM-binding protein-like A n=1 Tax=Corticium candelabrum TaxID=121492 RepID=UPI002E26DA3E|nr:STAM-binding protein-like A [Corticium candelabrum]
MTSLHTEPAARVRALVEKAGTCDVDGEIPFRRYYRSGLEMERMANCYFTDGDLEHALILYSRFITLFVERLPKYPLYVHATQDEKSRIKTKLRNTAFPRAEKIKMTLQQRYQKEHEEWVTEQDKKAAIEFEKRKNEEEAARLLQLDEERRQLEQRKAERPLEKECLQDYHLAEEKQDAEELQRVEKGKEMRHEGDEVSIEPLAWRLQRQCDMNNLPTIPFYTSVAGGGSYPVIESPSVDSSVSSLNATGVITEGLAGMSLYSNNTCWSSATAATASPVLGSESFLPAETAGSMTSMLEQPTIDRSTKPIEAEYSPVQQPQVDRSSKPVTPAEVTRLSSITDVGDCDSSTTIDGFRPVIVSEKLMDDFLRAALSNTLKNIETCGILCGKLSRRVFYITHVLVPKQTGTPDSCTTLNEEELFDYQDKYDLITLGWIHTHPSQTSFMSSVDLHTHCSYQLMLEEAIAIVCAPKHEQTGIFSLTRPFGLKYIAACREPGFHPHPKEPPLYEKAVHVTVTSSASSVLCDLR